MLKLIRRWTQYSRGVHWRMVYDSGMTNDIGAAGTCTDCGYRDEELSWPMPECKEPRRDAQ